MNPTKIAQADTSASQTAKAPADLWRAIATIIGLQNQAPPLVPVSNQKDLPLSFTQERLWFLDRLSPGSAAYNIPFALRLRGSLNISALERSIQEIVRRHEALRTTFTTQEGKPVQVISPPPTDWQLNVIDLSDSEKREQMQRLVREEARQPFNLDRDSLWRASLLKLDAEDHLLLITVHHIVFDGWSEGILWRELTSLYAAFSAGNPSPLAELPVQYGDFAVWQRQWLQGEFLEALLSYWQQQLGDNLRELQLPIDRPRPLKATRKSATYRLNLPTDLTARLKELSRQEGATLFPTLLAAFNVLLYRYTEQEDLFACSPIANRNRKELKNLMGYFVNLLVLRSDLAGNPSFQELLGRVRSTVSGAYAHQDLPVQQLVNRLDLVQSPLSQVMFVLQNTDRSTPELAGLTVEELEVDNGTADFDLSLSVSELNDTLIGVWKYNTDLYEEETIALMAERWQLVLEQIVSNPASKIDSLLVLNKRDRQQLKAMRNNRLSATYPSQLKAKASNSQPRNALELRLTQLWQEILDSQQVGIGDNFFDIGGSSLLAFRLIGAIEQSFNKKLPLSALLQAPTIEQLAKLIASQGNTTASSWLNPPQAGNTKPTLFCIPPAGNSLLGFANIVHHLGDDFPFYVPQPLGLEGETKPQERVEDMAAHYIREIQAIQPAGPYYLGGRCFGGIVAFEMARQLVQQGETVALLALIDGGLPPNIYSQLRNTDGSKKTKSLAQYWQSFAYFCRNGQLATILQYRYRQQLRKLKTKFLPDTTPADPLMANVKRVFSSHMKARSNYMPATSYPGKVTIFASGTLRLDQQAAWQELATEGIECHYVGGSHGTIDQEPYVGVLADKLRTCLNEAHQKYAPVMAVDAPAAK